MGDLFPVFRGTEEGLRVLVWAVPQIALIQNDQCAIVVHFGQSALGSPKESLHLFIYSPVDGHWDNYE